MTRKKLRGITVFLAYYDLDKERLYKWRKWLKRVATRGALGGFRIISDEDNPGGARWKELLERNIQNADRLVVFLSLRACYAYYNDDATFLRREIELALEVDERRRRVEPTLSFIVPVYLEDPRHFCSRGAGRLKCLSACHDIYASSDNDPVARKQLIEAISNTGRRIPDRIRKRLVKEVRG